MKKELRGGWVQYPLKPDKVGNFREDLDLIMKLLGSILYEWKKVDDVFYIRGVN